MSGVQGQRAGLPPRGRRGLVLALSLASSLLLLFVTPALGANTHRLKTTFGSFAWPGGIAVDQSTGNVFVIDGADQGGETHNWIDIFGPEGGPPIGLTKARIEGFVFGPGDPNSLAIDESLTSPSKGILYVADVRAPRGGGERGEVKKFKLEAGEYKPAGTLAVSVGFRDPVGIAIDAKGNVFVSDRGSVTAEDAIFKFGPAGNLIGSIDLAAMDGSSALAFDSEGNLFAQSRFGKGVWKFEADSSGEIQLSAVPTQIVTGSPTGIAIDQATDTLYVGVGSRIDQYSASCTPVAGQCPRELEFGTDDLGFTQRLAVGPLGDIYVTDRDEKNVAMFEAALSTIPDVMTTPSTAVTQSSATLNGDVGAAAGPAASCQFQYTTKASFDAEGFGSASTLPCAPPGPFTGPTLNSVTASVAGLSAEAAYVFRVVGSSVNGSNRGQALTFRTVGKPKINASEITQVTLTSATVEGLVNPNGGPGASEETAYAVEYVSEADFEASDYDDAISLPVPLSAGGEAIGSGIEDVKVAQPLSGLAPGTTYHFRIVAENEAGKETGPDKTFTTYAEAPLFSGCANEGLRLALGSGLLPNCRAYEQATPIDKNGTAPLGTPSTVQAASAGGAILFSSGGGIPGAEGGQQYPYYLASRGAGWTTQGLLPPASLGASAAVLGWTGDLSRSYATQATLAESPANFLERDSATRELRTIATDGGTDITQDAFVHVGAADDGSVVVFESNTPLFPGGAAKAFNTYAWDRETGELRLAGALNDNEDGHPPTKGSFAGSNDAATGRHHYNQAQHAVSVDGSAVFFTDAGTEQLFLRKNPARPQSPLSAGVCTDPALACTVAVSASQRTVPDPKGKKPAAFLGATPDGNRVFFTTPGKLTNDATTGPNDEGNDLYRYDVGAEELIDLAPDLADPAGAEVQGVLGISEDGSRVYFAAKGKLGTAPTATGCNPTAPSADGRACNLYLWDDGTIAFIARLQVAGPQSDSDNWRTEPNEGQGFDKTSRVSADGEVLLFRSRNQLTAYDNRGVAEFYRFQIGAPQLLCPSCNPTGEAPVGAAALRSIEGLVNQPRPAAIQTRNLSIDGDRFFFETPDKLSIDDTNGDGSCALVNQSSNGESPRTCQDVYEWEAAGAGSCPSDANNGGCLYLISTGASPEPSYFADADESGDNAFFFTEERLVGQDEDQIVDVYDARAGGGIAAQNPAPKPAPCSSDEACTPPGPAPPASPAPASSNPRPPGNLRPCKRGQVRKRGKCVKKSRSSHRHKRNGGRR